MLQDHAIQTAVIDTFPVCCPPINDLREHWLVNGLVHLFTLLLIGYVARAFWHDLRPNEQVGAPSSSPPPSSEY